MLEAVRAITILSLISMMVLGICSIIENKQRDKKHLYLLLIIASICVALSLELVSYHFEHSKGHDVLLEIVNYFDFIMGSWTAIFFVRYFAERAELVAEFKKHARFITIVVAGLSLVCIPGIITGTLFYFKSGTFVVGDFYLIGTVFCAVPAFYMFYLIARYRKRINRHDMIVTIMYLIFPLIGVFVQQIFEDYTFTYIAASFSVIIIYTMLQTGEANASKLRHELMLEFSRTDTLTGLQNRAAYREDLKRYKQMARGGVVYCDMNRLKYINDHFGHESGDAQILSFVELIRRYYNDKCIYRLSGDEFAIVVGDAEENSFDKNSSDFMQEVKATSEVASVGTAYGEFKDFDNLVAEAESKMYKAKAKYHKANPQFARF